MVIHYIKSIWASACENVSSGETDFFQNFEKIARKEELYFLWLDRGSCLIDLKTTREATSDRLAAIIVDVAAQEELEVALEEGHLSRHTRGRRRVARRLSCTARVTIVGASEEIDKVYYRGGRRRFIWRVVSRNSRQLAAVLLTVTLTKLQLSVRE